MLRNPKAQQIAIVLVIFLVLAIGLSFSCNPVNQVLKDKHKTEIVGREWAKVNPCVNDSVLVFQPGDTITNIVHTEDTLYYQVNDTIRLPYGINKFTTITKLVHDSIKVVVRDKRAEGILQDSVQHYFAKMKMYKGESEADKIASKKASKKAFWWKFAFYALIALALVYKFRFKVLKLVRHLIPVPLP